MLQHGDVKDKALFLFTASSGMRIDEVLSLKLEVLNLDHDPPMIRIPGSITKTGNPRYAFISQEAKEFLELWLKERKKYIRTAVKRCKHSKICAKNPDDDRIFPFSYDIAWTRWNYLLNKEKLNQKDLTTGRYILHIHSLRKYFLSQMKLEIPVPIAEALAGHEEYLDDAYRRYSLEQLGEYYKKGEHRLTILEVPPDLTEHNERITQLEQENKQLRKDLDKVLRSALIKKIMDED